MTYFPLIVRSHFSLLQSPSKISDLVNRVSQLNLPGCALCDMDNVSGCIEFHAAMKKAGLKPILGCELQVETDNEFITNSVFFLAKNYEGWKTLIKLVSIANKNFSRRERNQRYLRLADFDGVDMSGVISLSSEGFDFPNHRLLKFPNQEPAPNKDFVPSPNCHFCNPGDLELYEILACTQFKSTLKEYHEVPKLSTYPTHMLSYEEMRKCFSEKELSLTLEIADQCEDYEVTSGPTCPEFSKTPNKDLRSICIDGWKRKVVGKGLDEQVYGNRIKYELDVLESCGLSNYFLLIRDIIGEIKNMGGVVGLRGSAVGSMVGYLADLHNIDPMPYDLLFERFFNQGRVGSYPDCDLDVPGHMKDQIIERLKEKYGRDKVLQLSTFHTMKAGAALKDIMRAEAKIPASEQNRITKLLPAEARIAGFLQEMKQERGFSSIILWALENQSDDFSEWVEIKEGRLVGDLADVFEKAIKLEGVNTTLSKHAGGLIISDKPIEETGPIWFDERDDTFVTGWDMYSSENVGMLKVDLLGIMFLSKAMEVTRILKENCDYVELV